MTQVSRRRLLTAASGVGVATIAGCMSGSAEEEESGTRLHSVSVVNRADETQSIDLLVEYNGDISHWSTHDLEANASLDDVLVEDELPTDTGDFRITIRLNGSAVTQRTPADFNNPDCLEMKIEVKPSGDVAVWGVLEGPRCDGED